MSSKRRQEGYLLIDHRNAPGVPRNPAFEAKGFVATAPAGQVFESATVTCSHCQVIVVLNPNRQRPRGYCAKCDHYVCDAPLCNTDCRPFKALADHMQTAAIRCVADQNRSIFHLNQGD